MLIGETEVAYKLFCEKGEKKGSGMTQAGNSDKLPDTGRARAWIWGPCRALISMAVVNSYKFTCALCCMLFMYDDAMTCDITQTKVWHLQKTYIKKTNIKNM